MKNQKDRSREDASVEAADWNSCKGILKELNSQVMKKLKMKF